MTGASRGIGRAIARQLVEDGARVATVARSLREPERGTTPFECDLSDSDAVARLVPAVEDRLGHVDILVNNAAVAAVTPLVDLDLGEFDRVLAVNLRAPVTLMAAVVGGMAERGWGRIVNISSIHGERGERGALAYDIAKAGLNQATRTAAIELADRGVLVNAIAPGFVDTAMAREDGLQEEPFLSVYVKAGRLPLRRPATPDEIAVHVSWLANPKNTYLTGQVIIVDGGLTITF